MEKKPKILILLALYNGEKYIYDQIESILEQKNVDISLLISDNNSTDNSLQIINEFKDEKKIKVIKNKKTKGFAKNFFFLIKNVSNVNSYDYFAIADQDDIFFLNKYSYMVNYMKDKCIDCCSSALYELKNNSSDRLILQKNNFKKYDYLFEGGGQGCSFLLNKKSFYCVRKFLISNSNLVKDFYFHDWLIYLITRSKKYKWFFLNEPLTYYRQHENNNFGSKFSLNGFKDRLKKIRNGWYKKQVIQAFCIAVTINPEIKKSNTNLLLIKDKNLIQKIILSYTVIRCGRRRFIENMILIYSILFGYI